MRALLISGEFAVRRIAGSGSRLALRPRVLLDEQFNELRDRHRRIRLRPLVGAVLPGGDGPENGFGLGACLVGGYDPMSPQHHEAPRTGRPCAAGSIADDVSLGPALGDPYCKPLQFGVPNDKATRPRRCGVDRSLGQFGR